MGSSTRETRLPTGAIEHELAAARPRLLRLARAHGLALDTAHEAVQETYLEAWRHLDALSEPAGLHVWLNAICRNVCRRFGRASHALAQREVSLDLHDDPHLLDEEDGSYGLQPRNIPDPLAIDPVEELERHDRAILLDRALGYLAAPAREAVMLCYLAELPQRDAARQLGLTIAALEARLHRARRQLRQLLSGELRAQAESVGWALDADAESTTVTWRDTRLWCPSCARHQLRGAFEPLPAGRINLHLRCPGCAHEVNSWGHVPLQGLRSFRPAYKRVMRYTQAYFLPGLHGTLTCEACGAPQPIRLVAAGASLGMPEPQHQAGLLMATQCPACGRHRAEVRVATLLWTEPAVRRYLDAHPRSITEPEALVEYRGQPAIRVRMADVSSAERLTIVAHPRTLQVLATFQA